MRFAIATVFSASSNGANSLEEIYGPSNDDVCYVLENNRFYRWVAASTATPSGTQVVKKREYSNAVAGRWIVQGPPGPGQIPAGFANALNPNLSSQIVATLTGATVGGSASELVAMNPSAPTLVGELWDDGNALFIVQVQTGNPNIFATGWVSAANAASAKVVDASATPLPAALALRGFLIRLATG